MKKGNTFATVGMLIYLVLSIIDRFILEIADYIYVPIMVVAIILLVIGIVQNRRNK